MKDHPDSLAALADSYDVCHACNGSGIGRSGDTASNCDSCGGSGHPMPESPDTPVLGTQVTCVDLSTGESETAVIRNNHVVICDGNHYVDSIQRFGNGTTQYTIKVRL